MGDGEWELLVEEREWVMGDGEWEQPVGKPEPGTGTALPPSVPASRFRLPVPLPHCPFPLPHSPQFYRLPSTVYRPELTQAGPQHPAKPTDGREATAALQRPAKRAALQLNSSHV